LLAQGTFAVLPANNEAGLDDVREDEDTFLSPLLRRSGSGLLSIDLSNRAWSAMGLPRPLALIPDRHADDFPAGDHIHAPPPPWARNIGPDGLGAVEHHDHRIGTQLTRFRTQLLFDLRNRWRGFGGRIHHDLAQALMRPRGLDAHNLYARRIAGR